MVQGNEELLRLITQCHIPPYCSFAKLYGLSNPPVTPTGSFHFAPHATIKTGNPEKKRRKVSENELVTNWKLSPRVKNGRGSAEVRHELP